MVVSLGCALCGDRNRPPDETLQTSVHSLFAYREFPSGTLVTFCNLHFPSSSGRQYKSLHIVFQFATVPHFSCGAYLTARFKRGKRSSRIDLTLPSRILRFPIDSPGSNPQFLRRHTRRRFSIRSFNSNGNTWSTIRIENPIRRILPEFSKDGTSSRDRFTFVTPPRSVCVTTPIFVSARLFTLSCEG